MTASKRFTRITAILLAVICLVASIPTTAMAYDVNCNSVVSQRTFSIYKRWTQSIKIKPLAKGTARTADVGLEDLKMYGCFHITVYNSSGKKVLDRDWNGRSTITLVGAFTAVDTYKVVVSAPKIPSYYPGVAWNPRNNGYYWYRYPSYRISW